MSAAPCRIRAPEHPPRAVLDMAIPPASPTARDDRKLLPRRRYLLPWDGSTIYHHDPRVRGPRSTERITFSLVVHRRGMAEFLSQDDLDRIDAFVNTPKYRRSPDQLVPEDETDEE